MSVLPVRAPSHAPARPAGAEWHPAGRAPRPDRSPTRAAVRLARRLAADDALWRPHLDFDPAQRVTRRLLADDDHEAWLLTWLPGQGTGWHDHGGSGGAFVVLQGTLLEAVAPEHRVRALRRVHRRGGWQGFGAEHVHDVRNDGPDPAVSLHVYGPRLTVMRRFEEVSGVLHHVSTEREGADW